MCTFEHQILVEQTVYPTVLQCEWHSQHETLDVVQEADLIKRIIFLWIINDLISIIILPAIVRVTIVEFLIVLQTKAAVQCISVLLFIAVVTLIPIEMLTPVDIWTSG